jgi:hypothetical protein
MSKDDVRKQKGQARKESGVKETLEGMLDRLREGLEEILGSLRPSQPQPVPIPVYNRPRRR